MAYVSKFMTKAKPRYRKFVAHTTKAIAKRALRVANRISRGMERKLLDNVQSVTVGTAGVVFPLCFTPQNDLVDGREGNQITGEKVIIRWSMDCDPTDLSVICRLIVFCDKQNISDGTPAPADVLQALTPLSPLNRPLWKRFKIYRDKIFTISNATNQAMASGVFKINLKHLNIRFNGPLEADIQKNGIFLLIISDENTSPPTYDHHTRLHFTDN